LSRNTFIGLLIGYCKTPGIHFSNLSHLGQNKTVLDKNNTSSDMTYTIKKNKKNQKTNRLLMSKLNPVIK